MNTIAHRRSRRFENPIRIRPRLTVCLSLLLHALGGAGLEGQTVVVPQRLAESDGNTASQTPSGAVASGVRAMIIVDHTQFDALTGPAYLTQFAYRPDAVPGPSGPRLTNFKIYAATTGSDLSQLSTAFQANLGSDPTLVFSGSLSLGSANLPGPGNTRQFDLRLPLTTPFLYDPSAGNLVLELQIGESSGNAFTWDAVTTDPAIRYLFNNGSSTAAQGQFGSAPVLQFTFEPAPVIRIRTSQVEICWISVPGATYRVEWRDASSTGAWTSLVDCVRSSGSTTCVFDSVDGARPQRGYRVVTTECSPQ